MLAAMTLFRSPSFEMTTLRSERDDIERHSQVPTVDCASGTRLRGGSHHLGISISATVHWCRMDGSRRREDEGEDGGGEMHDEEHKV